MRKEARDDADGIESRDAPNYAPEASPSSLLICDDKVDGVSDKSSVASKLIEVDKLGGDSDLIKSTSVPL